MTDSHIMVIHTWVLADTLLKTNEVSLSLQMKQRTIFIDKDKIWALSSENLNFGEYVYTTMSLTASQYLETCDKVGYDINVIFQYGKLSIFGRSA